ncbi:hypothetical protein [Lutimonas sp.]|uniref:hypothetical protein n=1 Tax=Lutimonas sp. TaxID=1872403 RepID=UPI003D9BDDFE
MKNYRYHSLLYTCLLVLLSCTSEEIPKDATIIGTWQLIEMYSDPGDGSGTFRPVNSNKTIRFKTNNTFESNGIMCHLSLASDAASKGTFSETALTIAPDACELDVNLTYKIESEYLIIYYFCIEGCGEKFKKIN